MRNLAPPGCATKLTSRLPRAAMMPAHPQHHRTPVAHCVPPAADHNPSERSSEPAPGTEGLPISKNFEEKFLSSSGAPHNADEARGLPSKEEGGPFYNTEPASDSKPQPELNAEQQAGSEGAQPAGNEAKGIVTDEDDRETEFARQKIISQDIGGCMEGATDDASDRAASLVDDAVKQRPSGQSHN